MEPQDAAQSPTPPPRSAAVEFAGTEIDRLFAEIDSLRSRLEAAERSLAEERRALALWRSQPSAAQPVELSPQAINDLAEALAKLQRKGTVFRRILRSLR